MSSKLPGALDRVRSRNLHRPRADLGAPRDHFNASNLPPNSLESLTHCLVDQPVRSALICNDSMAVRVPDPARHAIYKIVLSQLRAEPEAASKAGKSSAQAGELIEALVTAGRHPSSQKHSGPCDPAPEGSTGPCPRTLALADKPLTLLAQTCYRFGEEPFTESADPVTSLREAFTADGTPQHKLEA